MPKTLFIDESGVADLTDYKYRKFLLLSVSVKNKELSTLEGYFSLIKRKYGLKASVPFHTYDLLEDPETKLSATQGKKFISSMEEFIRIVPLNITGIYTNKVKFRDKYKITEGTLKGSRENKEKRGLIYKLSALKHLQLFSDELCISKDIGYIRADSRTYQDRELLDAFLYLKQEYRHGGIRNPYYDKSRQCLVSITFAGKSALSSGIELADFISFVIFNHLERRMVKFKNISLGNVWRRLKSQITLLDLMDLYDKDEVEIYL